MPALAQIAAEEMIEAFGYAAKDPDIGLGEFEQALLGLDHHEAGAILLQEWGLPPGMIAVARHVTTPHYRGDHQDFVRLIGAAAAWKRSGFEALPQGALSLPQDDLAELVSRAQRERERILAEAQAIA